LDGSGKSTQIDLIQDYFSEKKIKYKYLHFPRTDSPVFGELIAKFLRGELGEISTVNPYLVALIYAGDRKDASETIHNWLNEGYTVLLDRYVHSNIAFQCAKTADKEKRELLKNWILHLEYEYFKIPKPRLSLFLDVPFSFTQKKLTQNRTGNDRHYLKGGRDIHEENLDFQATVREMYLWQIHEDKDFRLVNCSNAAGEMLSPEDIFMNIINELKI
jgi:dTMP kinase